MMKNTYANSSNGAYTLFRYLNFLFLVMFFFLSQPTSSFSQDKTMTKEIIVATVNDKQIFKSNVDLLIAQYKKKSGKEKVSLEQKKQILNSLITRQLILQNPEAQALRNDEIIFRKIMAYEENLITSKFVTDRVDRNIVVTDEEIKEYYKTNSQKFRSVEKVQVRGMLLKTREDAEKIMTKLSEGGDFVELAKENSIDLATARTGGRMELIEKGTGKVFPQIEEAVFKLKEAEVSDIIETDFGFNIFLVEQVFPARLIPFDDVKNDIVKTLIQEKKSTGFDSLSQNLQKDADIKIYESRLMDD